MSGRVEAIWIKRFHRGPMDPADHATLVAGSGIAGNADQGRKRQVTIIEREIWEEMMREHDASVDPSARRANLMVSGISLSESRDRILQVGNVRLRIAGQTRPCERMNEALPGLRETMQIPWRGGAFAEVLDDGEIAVGADVQWG